MNGAKLFFIVDPENGAHMLPDDDTGLVCPECTRLLNCNYINPKFKVPKKCPDISHTYDGFQVVSQKFREIIETEGYQGVEFISIPACPFFLMRVTNVLEFSRPSELKFEDLCHSCGRYASVWGLLHVKVIVPFSGVCEGLYRSDIEMGYRQSIAPILIVPEATKLTLKKNKLTGVEAMPAPV